MNKIKRIAGEIEGLPGSASNPLRAEGTIQEIALRVKSGQWTTLDLDALADFALTHGGMK